MTAVASTPSVSMATDMRLLHIRRPVDLVASSMEEREHGRNGKEDAIHYAKCKARFQHAALLIG